MRARGSCGVLALVATAVACDAGAPAKPVMLREPSSYLASVTSRHLRRLSRREYDNVVRDLLNDTTAPAEAFGPEVYVNGFDNGSDGLTVQGATLDDFRTAAEAVAARAVTSDLLGLVGFCDPAKTPDACADYFFSTFPARAYRRPPTDRELSRLRAVYASGVASGGGVNGIRLALEAILLSPSFLYREELGVADSRVPVGFVRLTPYEIASQLSFLFTGSTPDDALLAAAAGGRLDTPADFRREATRLLALPAAKPTLRAFLHEWLATDTLTSVTKDPTIYPTFGALTVQVMAAELDRYFDSVLGSQEGSLAALFTAPVFSSEPYRRGVMTSQGFLTAHANSDSSGPVARGVFVLDSLLCAHPPPPPPNVPQLPPPVPAGTDHQTTRQRFDEHVSNPTCKACHVSIDGVGFGFEEFDGLGVYRTTENGNPVDSSGSLLGTDVDGPFVGPPALETKLLASKQMVQCFLRHLVRYETGETDAASEQALLAVDPSFSASTRITDFLLALVSDPRFPVRASRGTTP